MASTKRSDGATVWWIYLIRCKNGRIYTGISPDPEKRFRQHQKRKSAHMRINGPVEIIGMQPVGSYGDAVTLERRIKRLSSAEKEELAATLEAYPPRSQ